jgi:hypothetical protein
MGFHCYSTVLQFQNWWEEQKNVYKCNELRWRKLKETSDFRNKEHDIAWQVSATVPHSWQFCQSPKCPHVLINHESVQWLGYGLDDRGSNADRDRDFFLFATASRPVLGPVQPPVKRVPEALSLGVKRSGHKADTSSPSTAGVKMCSAQKRSAVHI